MSLGRGGTTLLLLAAFIVVCAGLKAAASLLTPLLLAAFIASLTAPFVLWLKRVGAPVSIAVLLAILLDLLVIAGLGILVGTSITTFYRELPAYQDELNHAVARMAAFFAAYGVDPQQVTEVFAPSEVMSVIGQLLTGLMNVISNLVLVLLVVGFMLAEAAGVRTKITRLVSDDETYARLRRIASQVNSYLLVKSATSAFTGLCVGLWVGVMGLDFPVLWGLLAFLLNYIPTLGSIIASVPVAMLAFVQLGLGPAVVIIGGYTVINFVIGSYFEPRIFGRALGLSPLVVFLSMLFWGWLLGPLGALLSVPLTMIIKIYLMNTNDLGWVAVLLAPARHVAEDRRTFPPRVIDPTPVKDVARRAAKARSVNPADPAIR